MWLSADPALGDYIPQAPVNDQARKQNGNLPGMGGVFNTVNLHTYHYAGNNPVKYVDPDGKESGYVMDENAVGGAGHAGMYVRTEDGKYAFFEVTGLPDNAKAGDRLSGERNSKVLSNSKLSLPTPGSAEKAGKPTSAGVVRRDFETKEDMMNYLSSAGENGGYDSFVEFNTTTAQDKNILNTAMTKGAQFSGYSLIGNSCGIWAKDVLTTAGSGIINVPDLVLGSFMGGIYANNVPNFIGQNLSFSNGSDIRSIRR
jgi:hypothetical protein